MGITALIMAGGKGTRMALPREKPLLRIGGKPMIEHILRALQKAEKIDEIVVAITDHTPNTAEFIKVFPVTVLKTPGKGYVHDIQYAVKKLNLDTVLTISADLPLIRSEMIDRITEEYNRYNKPALVVAVPLETKRKLGLGADHILKVDENLLVPSGINVIDGTRICERELDEEILIIDSEELAVNVNTPRDLEIAQRLFKGNSRRHRC